METQTSIKRMYRSSMSGHYARVLYELNVPKTDIEKTKETFAEVPQLREVFINPTISAKIKMSVIDRVKADVKIQIVEDTSLLGGFILHVENDEYDWSLKGRLTRLEQKLTWR